MTTLQLLIKKNILVIIGIVLLACFALPLFVPHMASAQTVGSVVQGAANGPAGANPQPTVCDGGFLSTSSLNPVCWFRRGVSALSAALIQVAIWILSISGMLFNLLVDHTIVNFGKFLYSDSVKNAVETAWTAFRDISNIIIIGMFVFVAISIILGNQEYGQRKMVAKIIVIAVLINFSLLFTKVIIDFSNFSALQFYNAAQLQATDPNATAAAGATGNTTDQKGIAGAFLDYMGVSGIGDSYAAVRQAAEANDSGGIALIHGVVASIFLLAAAMVLFYGSFLLASRAILLIFLILTSSIAFATYLIPTFEKSKFGWSQWWSSLLRSAVFAPLLMILLWVTLAVGKALKDQAGTLGTQKGTLGDLMSNPTKGANMEALFGYLIVLGLLFISFKVASSFSASIGGFNYAAVLPASIAGAGSQFFGAVGRQTVGRFGYKAGEALQAQAKDPGRNLGSRKLFDFAAKPFQAAAKQDFNALRNSVGTAIAKGAGVKRDTLTGPKIGGFAGDRDAMLKKDAEKLARMNINNAKDLEAAKNVGKKPETPPAPVATPPVDRPPLMDKPTPTVDTKPGTGLKNEAAVRDEALKEYLNAKPQEKKAHEEATKEIKLSKDDLEALRRQNSDSMASLNQSIKGLKEQQTTLRSNKADNVAIARADEIEKEISKSKVETSRALKQRNEKIKEATAKSQVAHEDLERIEKRAREAIRDRAQTQEEQNTKQKEAGDSNVSSMRTFSSTISKVTEAYKKAGSQETYDADIFKKMKSQAREKRRQPMIKAAQDAAKKEVEQHSPPSTGGDKH